MTPSQQYAAARQHAGGRCPIEHGHLLKLADDECRHGTHPLDRYAQPGCQCHPGKDPRP